MWVNGNDDGTTHSTLRALNLGLDGTLHLALPLCLGEMLAVGLWDRNAETIRKGGECAVCYFFVLSFPDVRLARRSSVHAAVGGSGL